MIQNQFGRRKQRCELAFELEKLIPRRAGNQYTEADMTPMNQAAHLANVSKPTYNKAKRIDEKADEETKEKFGRPEKFKKL